MCAACAQLVPAISGRPPWWGSTQDVQLILDAAKQGYYPGGKRPRGLGFAERFLITHCTAFVRVRTACVRAAMLGHLAATRPHTCASMKDDVLLLHWRFHDGMNSVAGAYVDVVLLLRVLILAAAGP